MPPAGKTRKIIVLKKRKNTIRETALKDQPLKECNWNGMEWNGERFKMENICVLH